MDLCPTRVTGFHTGGMTWRIRLSPPPFSEKLGSSNNWATVPGLEVYRNVVSNSCWSDEKCFFLIKLIIQSLRFTTSRFSGTTQKVRIEKGRMVKELHLVVYTLENGFTRTSVCAQAGLKRVSAFDSHTFSHTLSDSVPTHTLSASKTFTGFSFNKFRYLWRGVATKKEDTNIWGTRSSKSVF